MMNKGNIHRYQIYIWKCILQIKLLLWKRLIETTKSPWEFIRIVIPPMLFFALINLGYATSSLFAKGSIEPFLVPFIYFAYLQRITSHLSYEKYTNIKQNMEIMGLISWSYPIAYFISDGLIIGIIYAFIGSIFSLSGLYNHTNIGNIFGYLLLYSLTLIPFSFFICCFVRTPQTTGQISLAITLLCYIIYIVIFLTNERSISLSTTQLICSFVPPLGLQIASGAFLNSYSGLSFSSICGILFADIFIYSLLTWYCSQIISTTNQIAQPFYFPLLPSYWFGNCNFTTRVSFQETANIDPEATIEGFEPMNESLLGLPTVIIRNVTKSFGSVQVVNDISFQMYENMIFSLLGHNGAGKTTTINMLTGLLTPNNHHSSTVINIYGHNILDPLDKHNISMGICPQHDVLFDHLTVQEHILFFAQLKGYTYSQAYEEMKSFTHLFHLTQRLHNTSQELSGGQRRKLSVAIAVCGGSKFVVLDEPTAGMDPLARRELWDLMIKLRQGRSILLTTHYMDEADVLGDHIGIMSSGKMKCLGSSHYLKLKYGIGYSLILELQPEISHESFVQQEKYLYENIQSIISTTTIFSNNLIEKQIIFLLPYQERKYFHKLFAYLETYQQQLGIHAFGLSNSTLEDVFLRVGEEEKENDEEGTSEDRSKEPENQSKEQLSSQNPFMIQGNQIYSTTFFSDSFQSQLQGIIARRLYYAYRDLTTIPLLLLPIIAAIPAGIIYQYQLISPFSTVNAVVSNALYVIGYLGIPGLLAEFVVKEKASRLRNVLNVMGCNYQAYWLGTWIADNILLMIPSIGIYITWIIFDMKHYSSHYAGLNMFILFLSNLQHSSFAYLSSYVFTDSQSCISFMPTFLLLLDVFPSFIFTIFNSILGMFQDTSGPSNSVASIIWWGTLILSPQGGLYAGLLATSENLSRLQIDNPPTFYACIIFMILQSMLFMYWVLSIEKQTIVSIEPIHSERTYISSEFDEDVWKEREEVLSLTNTTTTSSVASSSNKQKEIMVKIDRLRKVYPPVNIHEDPIIAVEDFCLHLSPGEIFGLLGANGAGKTTLLSMLTRLIVPTSGNALINHTSILTEFRQVTTQLGIVTQTNSLWEKLSVKNHLYLFAKLRGISSTIISQFIDTILIQLQLYSHQHKLAMQLSGGMKRKLCLAIALIGNPKVVLLDEPSAGLDPLSRRKLWQVILNTMQQRTVILTTHSMEEAEALCTNIGIMVKGQLHALGGKQHLKSKFGTGYELTFKISSLLSDDYQNKRQMIDNFIKQLYSSSYQLIYENGGLITYQIPSNNLQLSQLFDQLYQQQHNLGIEDYSIAQPTLEQVFIRIVNQITGSQEMIDSQEMTTTLLTNKQQDHETNEANVTNEVNKPKKNKKNNQQTRSRFGCSDRFLTYLRWLLISIFIISLIVGIVLATITAVGAALGISLAIIFILFVMIVTCLLNCLSCRYPIEEV